MKNHIKIYSLFCVIALLFSFVVPAGAAVSYPRGDANLDYLVDINDARQALRFAIKLDAFTQAHVKICDTDGDGVIKIDDARAILRHSIGLEKLNKNVSVGDEDFSKWVYGNGGNATSEIQPIIPAQPKVKNKTHGTFIFYVYGSGHGLGMSQYGAVGFAEAGYSYVDILSHYYTGCGLTTSSVPEKTYYCGSYINTKQLVARIVYQEIYGITNGGKAAEAIKAQAICAYTLLKFNNFKINSKWTAGVCSSKSYNDLPSVLKKACAEVSGLYITRNNDKNKSPVESLYCASVGGMTASNTYIFGSDVSYLRSVSSPFDMGFSGTVFTKILTKSQVASYLSDYGVKSISYPSKWIQILDHTSSIDINRGYVTCVKVGNTVIENSRVYSLFHDRLGLSSTCFTVEYVP